MSCQPYRKGEPIVLTAHVVAPPVAEPAFAVVIAPPIQLEQNAEFLIPTVSQTA